MTDILPSVTNEQLLLRAVKNARQLNVGKMSHPRWAAVMQTFSLGSTYAQQLCRYFGLDPDEQVTR